MKVNLIVAHPKTGSFNHAIANKVAQIVHGLGHTLKFHDLYAERFDPVLPAEELDDEAAVSPQVQEHINDLVSADVIVIVHPNWWSQAPAILRGWVDRVFRSGVAYRFVHKDGEVKAEGLLRAQVALIFNTANTPHDKELELYGDPLDVHWRKVVFGLCGVKRVIRRVFAPIVTSTPEQRRQWLHEVQTLVELHLKGLSGS